VNGLLLVTTILLALTGIGLFLNLALTRRLIRAREDLIQARRAEDKYRLLVTRLPALVWTVDKNLVFTSSEGGGLATLGLTPGQVVGMTLTEYFGTDNLDFFPILSHRRALDGESAAYEFHWEDAIFQTYVDPLRDRKGKVVGAIGVAVNTTEARQAAKALQDSERQLHQVQKLDALGSLAGGIAHDFNNILTPILGYAHMLRESLAEDSVSSRDVRQIEKAALRAKDLVSQILVFGRQSEVDLEPVSLNKVVEEATRLLRASIPTLIEIDEKLPEVDLRVMADPTQIHQIVINLGTNAFHAIPDHGGRITVELEAATVGAEHAQAESGLHPGVFGRIAVTDTGHGMTPQVRDRVFEPFFTTKEVGKGAGLGLSVIHGIVRSLNGAVLVESEPGRGSRFEVYLPLTEQEAGSSEVAIPIPEGRGERILVVDDEETVAVMAARLLERKGYRVDTVTDPQRALERFSAGDQYDLMVTDFSMPGLTGCDLAGCLQVKDIRIPVILMTGFRDSIAPGSHREMGISHVLLKPLVPGALERAVREVLDAEPPPTE